MCLIRNFPSREDLVRRILRDALIGSRDLELVPAIRDGLDRDGSRTFMDDKGDWSLW